MLVFRKLAPQEINSLKQHLLRLDAEDRRLRFGHCVTTEVLLAYCDAVQWEAAWRIGAFEGPVLRGVAELRDLGGAGAEAGSGELSVSVERAWQNRGVGTRLMEEALLMARNRGFGTLHLLCLPGNPKMQHLARKFSDRIRMADGEVEVQIRSPQPDPLSCFAELLGDAVALWQTALDRIARGAASPERPPVTSGGS